MKGIELRNLQVERSGAVIIGDLSFDIPSGEITVLLGPNGGGKSTLLDAICGVIPVSRGSISLDGLAVQELSRLERVKAGISYVEQGRQVFSHLSVEHNLRAACANREQADRAMERSLEVFPELRKRLNTAAGMLSGGEQQMIVIARSMIRDPKVMLIDELSLGLAPIVVSRFLPLLERLKHSGMAILLVEQYATAALAIGDQAVILVHGACALSEGCAALRADPQRLHQAYLGAQSA
ncbi:ABC transporter ATP-binding protein [Pseudomonas sp. LRF_L74]|uniref:ABC transporter ATP-binding protein n=1 Tax=Pseudomonas sp. LRF_L74 TaxID=3369422 RepID=UPI003F63D318